jgi:hypothetical protein
MRPESRIQVERLLGGLREDHSVGVSHRSGRILCRSVDNLTLHLSSYRELFCCATTNSAYPAIVLSYAVPWSGIVKLRRSQRSAPTTHTDLTATATAPAISETSALRRRACSDRTFHDAICESFMETSSPDLDINCR